MIFGRDIEPQIASKRINQQFLMILMTRIALPIREPPFHQEHFKHCGSKSVTLTHIHAAMYLPIKNRKLKFITSNPSFAIDPS